MADVHTERWTDETWYLVYGRVAASVTGESLRRAVTDDILAVLADSGRLLPDGGETNEVLEWRICFVDHDGQKRTVPVRNETFAGIMLDELVDKGITGSKERRTVTAHSGQWEPVDSPDGAQ